MAHSGRVVIGGVDTYSRTHHAAIIDQHGRLLADAEFGAHTDGYRRLLGGCVGTDSSAQRVELGSMGRQPLHHQPVASVIQAGRASCSCPQATQVGC